jgi:hypothetical protein
VGNEREGGTMGSFLFSGSEFAVKVGQTVGGTGLDLLTFRCPGL